MQTKTKEAPSIKLVTKKAGKFKGRNVPAQPKPGRNPYCSPLCNPIGAPPYVPFPCNPIK